MRLVEMCKKWQGGGRSFSYRGTLFASLCIASFALPCVAGTWYVSPTGDNAASGTESAPWRTIQYAVNTATAVDAGDTIVLLPGDYAEGSTTVNSIVNRANVTKQLTIRSLGREYRDTTRIVGAWDKNATSPVGIGDDAMRCLRIATTASGTRVEGITFYKGSTTYNGNNGADKSEGGGVYVANGVKAVIVDCAFVDCQATRGGGLYNDNGNTDVQAIRCLFKRCRDTKFGAAMRGGSAYFCVFDDCCMAIDSNGSTVGEAGNAKAAFAYGYRAVNCTFVNNEGYGIKGIANTFNGGILNCLFQNNSSGSIQDAGNVPGTKDGNTDNIAYNTARMEVFSPFDGDYRLTSVATAKTTGSATYATTTYVPSEFVGIDYAGNAFDTAGTVCSGAVQDALSEASSGVGFACTVEGRWTLDGEEFDMAFRTWRGTVGWPVPQKVGFVPASGRALVRFGIGGTPLWPLPDNTAWTHPNKTGIAQTMGALTTANIFYVDPEDGDDDTGDGTEAKPFKTITKAIQYSTATHVVVAKAGDYANGAQTVCGFASRVAVQKTLAGEVRVIAESGPGETFITGTKGTADSTYNTGTDAVRCIGVASTNAFRVTFQGFTIRDGHTNSGDGSGTEATMGGALANVDTDNSNAALSTAYLLDCVIDGCTGGRGGVMNGGNALRCIFRNCEAQNNGGGVFRNCSVISSLIDGCGGSGRSPLFTWANAFAYNCTMVNSTVGAVSTASGAARLYNCVAGLRQGDYNALNSNADSAFLYTLYDTIDSGTTAGTGSDQENPILFADTALGNYRLTADSKGATLASTAYLQSCMDLNGNPFAFDTASGTYQAGCYAAIRGGTYYVDATGGSDANDGSAEDSAFATLTAAMAAAQYGDTIIALPGTYATGSAVPSLAQAGGSVTPTVASRVVVKSGVTLESRDGAATTIIQGAADATTGGCGAGAVRCAFVCKGATLRGFTLTGGYTGPVASSMTVNDVGGGVCGYYAGNEGAADDYAELIENCVITGNTAIRGGGAMYGWYRNCVFTNNALPESKPGYALARAKAEGCYFAGNGPSNGHSAIYYATLVNCTVRGGQAQSSGAVCNEGGAYRNHPVLNSVIVADSVKFHVATNCVIGSTTVISTDSGRALATNNVVIGHASLDANGVPQAASNAIDAGDNSFCSAGFLASRDPAGTRRVLNSVIDCGAYEFDWGVPWGASLGGSRLAIDDMPSEASFSEGRLAFGEGTVSMTWAKGAGNSPYQFTVNVTGNGSLVVKVNGVPLGRAYTSADGAQDLRFSSLEAFNSLSFAYNPGDGDAGGVQLYGFAHNSGMMFFIR